MLIVFCVCLPLQGDYRYDCLHPSVCLLVFSHLFLKLKAGPTKILCKFYILKKKKIIFSLSVGPTFKFKRCVAPDWCSVKKKSKPMRSTYISISLWQHEHLTGFRNVVYLNMLCFAVRKQTFLFLFSSSSINIRLNYFHSYIRNYFLNTERCLFWTKSLIRLRQCAILWEPSCFFHVYIFCLSF